VGVEVSGFVKRMLLKKRNFIRENEVNHIMANEASVVSATRGAADFAGDFLETNFSEGCVRAASACTGTLGAISALATAGSGAMMGAGSAMLANSVGGKTAGIALTVVGALGVVGSTGGRGG
jgi:hypothetical protein